MAVLDELSVNVGADVADFTAGASRVEEGLDNLSTGALTTSQAMNRLANKTEQVGDNMTRTAVKASAATVSIAGAGAAATTTAIGFEGLGAAGSLVLLPALAALLTTLAPLTATLTGLASATAAVAGAFGLVAGSGAVAFSQVNDLEKVFKELRQEIVGIVSEFGEQFLPLIEDAIDALPDLIENTLAATGNLTAFKESLRDFGQAAFRIIPDITEELFTLARRALPVVIDTFQWLEQNGGGIFDAIMRTTRNIAPVLLNFGRALADIAPTLNRIGTTVLKTVVPAFGDFLGALDKLLQGDIQGGLIDPVKGIIDDVVTFLNSDAAQTQLDKVSTAFFGAVATALDNTSKSDISGVTGSLGSALTKAVSNLSENFEESGLATELGELTGDVISVVGTQLEKASNDEEFQKKIATIGSNIGSALADAITASIKASLTDFEVTDLFGGVGFAFENTEPGELSEQQQTIVDAAVGTPYDAANTGTGNNQTNVTVEVAGDTGVIDERATRVIEERENAATRGTGGVQRP